MIYSTKLLKRVEELNIINKGQFKLASGNISSIYIDARLISLDSLCLYYIGMIIYHNLKDCKSIGGPATSAIPILSSVISIAGEKNYPLFGFYHRAKIKTYGMKQSFEGNIKSPLMLVDDICTSGGSILKLANIIKADDHTISQIITLIDRGGGDSILKAGYNYNCLLKFKNNKLSLGNIIL